MGPGVGFHPAGQPAFRGGAGRSENPARTGQYPAACTWGGKQDRAFGDFSARAQPLPGSGRGPWGGTWQIPGPLGQRFFLFFFFFFLFFFVFQGKPVGGFGCHNGKFFKASHSGGRWGGRRCKGPGVGSSFISRDVGMAWDLAVQPGLCFKLEQAVCGRAPPAGVSHRGAGWFMVRIFATPLNG